MFIPGLSTETKREAVVSGAFSGIGRNKLSIIRKIAWVVGKLLPFVQRYTMKTKVTFGLTNGAGVVGHDRIANLFGTARELFGLSRIPGFAKEVGQKYLLKTCDADYCHEADFRFGDTIKIVIDVTEVNGASFKLRGRFIDKDTGKICATALQTIAYTNMQGRPVRFPSWLKILLELSRSQDLIEDDAAKNKEVSDGREISLRQVVVTSDMTNAERNVNHDEYAKMLTQTVELFFLNGACDRQVCSLGVEASYYKYNRDFFFGDSIMIKLKMVEVEEKSAVFSAEFCDQTGKVCAFGRQKIRFFNQDGEIVGTPLAIRVMPLHRVA